MKTHQHFLLLRVVDILMSRLNRLWPCLGVILLWALLLLISPWIPGWEIPSTWRWSVDTLRGQLWTLVLELLQWIIDALPFLLLFGTIGSGILWLMWSKRPVLSLKQWAVSILCLAYFFLLLQLGVSLLDALYLTINGSITPDIMQTFVLFDLWLLCMVVVLLVCAVRSFALPAHLLIGWLTVAHARTASADLSRWRRAHLVWQFLLYEGVVFWCVSFLLDYLVRVSGRVQFLCLVLLALWMFGWYLNRYEDLTKTWNR